MTEQQLAYTNRLLRFIDNSPTSFHAAESMVACLEQAGFVRLFEGDSWNLTPDTGYFVTRNQSSVLAFRIPKSMADSFMIAASHTDSPMFKLKTNFEAPAFDTYMRFNTEAYGGTILSSWMDRPLSVAGRVIIKQNGGFCSKTVKLDKDLLMIPNVAIHMNRSVNAGYTWNPSVDMLPLFSQKGMGNTTLKEILANTLECKAENMVGMDLYVYNRMLGTVWGADDAFFSAPRIDNLMCVFGTLEGFLATDAPHAITVCYAADNEETGSATKQGAGSVFLSDVLDRICGSLGQDKRRMLAASMMVSADNGHAKHPNHPELSDAQNAPMLNGGVVVKSNAAQKYTTDGISAALFEDICKCANVPIQSFSNRSDIPGGSTLGSISNTQVPLITVDIGMAQLAMHSAYETAGTADTEYLVRAMRGFYNARLIAEADGAYRFEQ